MATLPITIDGETRRMSPEEALARLDIRCRANQIRIILNDWSYCKSDVELVRFAREVVRGELKTHDHHRCAKHMSTVEWVAGASVGRRSDKEWRVVQHEQHPRCYRKFEDGDFDEACAECQTECSCCGELFGFFGLTGSILGMCARCSEMCQACGRYIPPTETAGLETDGGVGDFRQVMPICRQCCERGGFVEVSA